MAMTVGIDLRCLPLDGSEGAGVAHAARFLVQELVRRETAWKWRLYIPRGAIVENEGRAEIVQVPDQTGSSLRRVLKERGCDVLFVPAGPVPWDLPIHAIPWVHDVAIYDHPEWFPQSWIKRMVTTTLFRHGICRAPLVFAVSKDTKRDIVKKFGYDPGRVIATHEGGDPVLEAMTSDALEYEKQQAKSLVAKQGIIHSFLLVLGTVEPRKNIPVAVQAWQKVCLDLKDRLDLVIAGRDGWKCPDIPRDIPSLHRLTDIDDNLRRGFLLAADIVLVPSWYEGFSLVALEAMQAGTPVIAARTGALPEVVGEGGVLLGPGDISAWVETIQNILQDQEKRAFLSKEAKRQSLNFSWQKTADRVMEGLSAIVDNIS